MIRRREQPKSECCIRLHLVMLAPECRVGDKEIPRDHYVAAGLPSSKSEPSGLLALEGR